MKLFAAILGNFEFYYIYFSGKLYFELFADSIDSL